ncbi:type II toxin-antitoxin system VapC family toxin [Nocardia seriolae]|uniref:Ribonuclease VapC n=1 Tax=Nocardia seriolae TaxID=37332 RepID=A0A0B8NMR0_9NOCA|nr:type II toxin-antitoxin system VapC family toxin [Nocardia seriolae]APA94527.1 Ribonuclease VapC35 [Nocardia seriolae]MTJ66854.1 PIN domain-containing protein [Nocardia seriolae]MTJ76278.1 PIN domain-containing protein [Nocardia seriolae]MTJ84839.1 PIN domain-containing protein [Nocardia seriolae]MTK28826.1 PIN domain-containing protein [Nocardia seriolae]
MIYLDSAAVVKLAHREAESDALRGWLADRRGTPWVSSTLIEVEAFRAVARHSPEAVSRLASVLALVDTIEMGARVRSLARAVLPVTVRSLDAVHLATALTLGADLTAFVTYDKRLADAARSAGLTVEAPEQISGPGLGHSRG